MSIFSNVKGYRPRKRAFNLSHSITQTQDIGELVPCYVHDDLLPGSRERLSVSTLCRFQAMLAPLQHNVYLYTHFWYVPYRLLDENFPKFISGEMMRDGVEYEPYKFTYYALFSAIVANLNAVGDIDSIDANDFFRPGSLLEYLGYPSIDGGSTVTESHSLDFNMRRIQAFFLILCERYVNENFKIEYQFFSQSTNILSTEDFVTDARNFAKSKSRSFLGVRSYMDVLAGLLLHFKRKYNSHFPPHAWFKDYFTSALPFTQLGDEVSISLAESAPVKGSYYGDFQIQPSGEGAPLIIQKRSDGGDFLFDGDNADPGNFTKIVLGENEMPAENDPMYADLSEASSITINELRIANAIQSLKESFARFGTRYQEWLRGFWHVKASDQSIQLPEWLGGNRTPINISEVDQTSATDNSEITGASTPQGNLAGKGMGISSKYIYNRWIEEPGLILGFCFLQPKAVYPTSGVDRHLLKINNLYDYFTSKLEHVGEQEVYNSELFYAGSDQDLGTFGYQSRYAEYKFIPSRFRGQFAGVLDFWHLGRKFDNLPNLSNDFLYVDKETMKRPFAVQEAGGTDISNAMLWFNFKVDYIAPMSHFGTPSLLN